MINTQEKSPARKTIFFYIYAFLRRILLWKASLSLRLYPTYHIRKFFYGYTIANVNGFKMYLDLKNDTGISKDLFVFGKREVLCTDLLQNGDIVHAGDTVLDIGANIGYYALLEARLVKEDGQVYAIEPVSNNYRLLQKNIELNALTNIRAFRMAAGKESKEDEIYVASKGNISSFIYREDVAFVKKESVHVTTVDEFVSEHQMKPDLIRMDVEGYETEIIQGMQKTLLQHPKLLIEVHPHLMSGEKLERMFATIQESGYRTAVLIKERNELWMKKNGDIKTSLAYLTHKMGMGAYTLGMGKMEHVNLEELRGTLQGRGSAFHVLLS